MSHVGMIRGNHGTISNYGDSPIIDKSDQNWGTPLNILFIYVRINEDGTMEVDHYQDRIKTGSSVELEQKQLDLLSNARPFRSLDGTWKTGSKDPQPIGHNFTGLSFEEPAPSYMIIVLDEKRMRFVPDHRGGSNSPIVFLSGKDIVESDGSITHESYAPNHSYYNLERITIADRPAVRMINYMRRPDGSQMRSLDELTHAFNIMIEIEFSRIAGNRKGLVVVLDPRVPDPGRPKV